MVAGLDETGPQMSDFEYLGRAYKDLVARVPRKIIDEKGEGIYRMTAHILDDYPSQEACTIIPFSRIYCDSSTSTSASLLRTKSTDSRGVG
jgi:hypothetical protein